MSTFKNFEITFKNGVEFEENTAAGLKCKVSKDKYNV